MFPWIWKKKIVFVICKISQICEIFLPWKTQLSYYRTAVQPKMFVMNYLADYWARHEIAIHEQVLWQILSQWSYVILTYDMNDYFECLLLFLAHLIFTLAIKSDKFGELTALGLISASSWFCASDWWKLGQEGGAQEQWIRPKWLSNQYPSASFRLHVSLFLLISSYDSHPRWFNLIDLLRVSFSTTFYILRKIHENFTEISSFFWRIYHHKCVINTIDDIKSIFEINTINSSAHLILHCFSKSEIFQMCHKSLTSCWLENIIENHHQHIYLSPETTLWIFLPLDLALDIKRS